MVNLLQDIAVSKTKELKTSLKPTFFSFQNMSFSDVEREVCYYHNLLYQQNKIKFPQASHFNIAGN